MAADTKKENKNAGHLERIARILRDSYYGGKPIGDNEWDSVRKHWLKDAQRFLDLIDTQGLKLVEKESTG